MPRFEGDTRSEDNAVADPCIYTGIGVISGTSMDGIDVALVRTDGTRVFATGPSCIVPYEPAVRAALIAVVADPVRAEHDPLVDLEMAVTEAHAAAVLQLLEVHAIPCASVDVVGMHGQTILHKPRQRFTRQLLDGRRAAERLGRDVVNRFRHADVAAGGEGAPLVPLYHRALAHALSQPLMVLNLGGVGNVTYLDGDTVIAFDSGPGSALIDDFLRRRRGLAFDQDGAIAAGGRVDAAILAALMADPYFAREAPKSLDRNAFHAHAAAVDALSDADGAATLTAFTVAATAAALQHCPRAPRRWLVGGGGRLNATLMRGLRDRLGVPVDPVESVGWNGDTLEAECFGFLAVRSLLGLPISLPTTTGVPTPMTGGDLWRAPAC
jgi:anhydro-N-acetylmuramic acid kinase